MSNKFLAAIVLSFLGAFGFIIILVFFITGLAIMGIVAIAIPLICYFIIDRKLKEYFWKSFLIGSVVGVALGLFVGASIYAGYMNNLLNDSDYQQWIQDQLQTGDRFWR